MKTETTPVTLLSIKAPFPYSFKGKDGIAYSAIFMIGESIMPVKITEQQYNILKDSRNEDGKAVFEIGIFNNAIEPKLKLASFSN